MMNPAVTSTQNTMILSTIKVNEYNRISSSSIIYLLENVRSLVVVLSKYIKEQKRTRKSKWNLPLMFLMINKIS